MEDGFPALVLRGVVGVEDSSSCIRPLHTVEEKNVIHIAYDRPHDFTLRHFFCITG